MLFKSTWDILGVKYFEIEGSAIYISSQIFSDYVRILSALVAMSYVPYMAKTFGENQERISKSLLSELHRYQLVSVSIFFIDVGLCLFCIKNNWFEEWLNFISIQKKKLFKIYH